MRFPSSTSSSERSLAGFFLRAALFLAALGGAQTAIYLAINGDARYVPAPVRAAWDAARRRTPAVYFGDSVIARAGENDPQGPTIPEVLQTLMPETPIAILAQGAYNPSVYRDYADWFLRRPNPPRLWIVPINLRSFSAGWVLRPEWQFRKERLLLQHDSLLFRIFFRPLQVFKTFELTPVKPKDFDGATVFDGDRPVGRVSDFLAPPGSESTPAAMERMLVLDYMASLHPEHPKVRGLVTLCRELKGRGLEPFFYITPVDYETGGRYVGKRFAAQIEANAGVLARELSAAGCPPRDWALAMRSDVFNWRIDKFPNEHLMRLGRRALAEKIRRALAH